VTIRKTLLVAFLSVGLLPAILLATLAFVKTQQSIQAEIERNLVAQAGSISVSIDKMMFERLENAATWSRLDVMQDIQVRDIDKRLSMFLSGVQKGYSDDYLDLAAVDANGQVVSSSNANEIGQEAATSPAWLKIGVSGVDASLALPSGRDYGALIMRTPIVSAFTGEQLGQLQLTLDWNEFLGVLDQASASIGRSLAVLDAQGRVIAASADLRQRGLMLSEALKDWPQTLSMTKATIRAGNPVADDDVIVGAASSNGLTRIGEQAWTTLVIQPVDKALAPVHRMAMIFLGLLAGVVAITVILANWVSRAISEPIVDLTRFTRGYMRNRVLQAPPTTGKGEVGELSEAFVQMVQDIDQSQRNLIHASKLAVVGEMSSLIAHEVRTPLGILRSSAQMLQREEGISDEGLELVGFIESETERLNRLVSAMLDTARPRLPTFLEVDIAKLVAQVVAMLGAQFDKRGIRVEVENKAANPLAECDEEQITQVLLNLLMNAMQILASGGRIDVTLRDDQQNIEIEIGDDGPGIPQNERTKIFEAFFFKREGGIGLGLAVVQRIVAAHRGDIEVDESPRGGALFKVRLPRAQPDTK
jgi:signal transduction histidine kinase